MEAVMNRPIKVIIVCTGRHGHKRTQLAYCYHFKSQFAWWSPGVEFFAGQARKGQPGYTGERYRFPSCARCGLNNVVLRGDKLSDAVDQIKAASGRTISIDIDVSLIG